MTEESTKPNFLDCEKILVDLSICTKCKACVNDCPVKVYFIEDNDLNIADYTDKKCMECGHCVAVCPVNAISLKNPLYKDVEAIPKDIQLPSYNILLNLYKTNRSIRQFKDKPIPDELWNKLIEAASFAPTGHNFQEVEFTVVRTPGALKRVNDIINKGFLDLIDTFEDKEKRKQIIPSIPKKSVQLIDKIIPGLKRSLKRIENGEDPWRWGGELLIIHGSKKPTTLVQDCSLAAAYTMMAAHSLGLGTCSLDLVVGAIARNKYFSKFIKLPRNHIAPYVLAVGFPKVKYHRIPARKPVKVRWF